MTANTTPIFSLIPKTTWGKVTAADGSTDGTDADVVLVYTANATDGGFISRIIAQPISTSGSTNTSAANIRLYLNNGSTVATGTNNILFKEVSVPLIAVGLTATTTVGALEIPLNFQMQAGYRIYVGVSAMAANTQWNFVAIAGDYS